MAVGRRSARVLDDAALEMSAVVANCAMNRERQLARVNSYARELGSILCRRSRPGCGRLGSLTVPAVTRSRALPAPPCPEAWEQLTPQGLRIARMAADGLATARSASSSQLHTVVLTLAEVPA